MEEKETVKRTQQGSFSTRNSIAAVSDFCKCVHKSNTLLTIFHSFLLFLRRKYCRNNFQKIGIRVLWFFMHVAVELQKNFVEGCVTN